MGRGIWTVMKKELARFFKDKRLCLTTLLLPGLMIYVIYSFMGDALSSNFTVQEEYDYSIEAIRLPQSIQKMSEQLPFSIQDAKIEEQQEIINSVQEQECDLLIVFPQDFDEKMRSYSVSSGVEAPNIEIYYNSANTESSTAYEIVTDFLDQFETSLVNKFDINRGQNNYDLADEQDLAGMTFAMMMPMLIMMFLFPAVWRLPRNQLPEKKKEVRLQRFLSLH